MPKQTANLFPEDIRYSVAKVFAEHDPQIILLKVGPSLPIAGSCYRSSIDKLLHPQELARFEGYKLPKRRYEFLAGRYCAKIVIINYLHKVCAEAPALSMNEIEIHAGPGGRPTPLFHGLPIRPPIDISIAHSGAYAAALATDEPCGIDLQQFSTTLPRVQSRFCTQHELQRLQDILPRADSLELLTFVWTAKEAAKKALGYWKMPGFLDLEVIDVQRGRGDCRPLTLIVKRNGLPELPRQTTVVVSTFDNYGLAVCIVNKDQINA